MKKIKQFLKDNDYNFYEIDDTIEGWNNDFKVMVIKNDTYYLVRMAVKCYFDRWANSGSIKTAKTQEDVIKVLQSPDFITDVVSELLHDIILECQSNGNGDNLSKTIKQLRDILCGEMNIGE